MPVNGRPPVGTPVPQREDEAHRKPGGQVWSGEVSRFVWSREKSRSSTVVCRVLLYVGTGGLTVAGLTWTSTWSEWQLHFGRGSRLDLGRADWVNTERAVSEPERQPGNRSIGSCTSIAVQR